MRYLESIVVDLTSAVPVLSTWFQRYVQSAPGVYDVTDRANIAWVRPGCLNVRFFDPDGLQTPLYTQPTECNAISVPIGNTNTEVQQAYSRGDFSIRVEGYDVVYDLGFEIRGLFDDNGDPITFAEFLPGYVYVYPEVGMFMFFHYPDKWDNCSYWDMAWWDHIGLTDPPYAAGWDDDSAAPLFVPPAEDPAWDDINNPIPLNTYWDIVSEAPGVEAAVIACYWTKDNADPIANSPRSHRYTSPITLYTDTQIRYLHVDLFSIPGPVFTDTYEVGLRLDLQKGVNLISQPRVLTGPAAELSNLVSGLSLRQIFRVENGLWQVYMPSGSVILDDFNTMDNQHGYFMVMYGPGSFCIPYGSFPETTELTLVNKTTNRGFSAIGVPRKSTEDNSIANLLISRDIDFDELYRVTNGIFETYIVDRAAILNFSPADLTPGRGYGVITETAQTFELPFTD